ncbi:GD15524 [Drosophila simulans]|uniref:GD15524 n=1 Tax=Drosophila simulans TaxID=7240 RepID=B4R3B1_DROSI|nr:GD15524 [Drosophila simulans]
MQTIKICPGFQVPRSCECEQEKRKNGGKGPPANTSCVPQQRLTHEQQVEVEQEVVVEAAVLDSGLGRDLDVEVGRDLDTNNTVSRMSYYSGQDESLLEAN